MVLGGSVDKHHFVPKSRGGREQMLIHRVCHNKIHSLWSNKELEREFSDPDTIKNHPMMQDFLTFIRKKDPEFYCKSAKKKS